MAMCFPSVRRPGHQLWLGSRAGRPQTTSLRYHRVKVSNSSASRKCKEPRNKPQDYRTIDICACYINSASKAVVFIIAGVTWSVVMGAAGG